MDQEKPQGQFSRFQAACRSAGLKLTHQRLEIYRELTVAKDHPSAEALYQRLIQKIPTLSLDTVYRTLATFTRHGLAHRVETVESQARFDAKHERHHHAICSRCHEIIDFNCPSVEEVGLPEMIKSWGKINSRNLVIYGICKKCFKKDGSLTI